MKNTSPNPELISTDQQLGLDISEICINPTVPHIHPQQVGELLNNNWAYIPQSARVKKSHFYKRIVSDSAYDYDAFIYQDALVIVSTSRGEKEVKETLVKVMTFHDPSGFADCFNTIGETIQHYQEEYIKRLKLENLVAELSQQYPGLI